MFSCVASLGIMVMLGWSGLVLTSTYLCQFLLLLSPASARNATDERTELRILYITSSGGEYNSSGTIPAIGIALEEINNRSDVLPDYRLVYELGDSQCDAMIAQREFFNAIIRGAQPIIAVVGAGCSIATESVAEVSQFWNITHLSYASSTTSLNNRKLFPNFWRTYPSEDNLAKAVVAVVQQYGWKQLKIITQDETLFTATSEMLKRDLTEADVFVDANGTILFDSDEDVANTDDLFSPEIRVYFLNMYSIHARRVMCAAVQATPTDELYYPSYVWITLGWYADRWWTQEVANDPTVNCIDAQFEPLLKRTLAIQQIPTAENRTGSTNVSLTAEEFFDLYEQRLNETTYSFESTAPHAYDAVWAIAFAIDRALPQLGPNLTLEDFDYPTTAASISSIVQQQLNSSDFFFTGVSGLVTFNQNGTRIATQPAEVLQYRNRSRSMSVLCEKSGTIPLERVRIGTVNSGGEFNYTDCDDDNTTWPAGIPSDGTPEEAVTSIHLGLFITYAILTSLGILFAIFCLFFNIIFKKSTIVRLTSPNLNYVIIVGAIMLYSSVYFFVIPSKDELTITTFCQVRIWLQAMGYFLCFGTIVAKMWRVYYIFHDPLPKKKYRPKDWHLFLAAVVLTMVGMVILIFVAILDDYNAKSVPNKERDSTRNADRLLVNYSILKCDGKNSIIWIILLYGYVALIQVVAVILAFRTRKVKMKALNDAKYIAIIIYFTTVILTVMIIGAITLEDFINADAGVFGGGLIVFTTAVLVLIFIPKMVILYKDPRGEKINYSDSPSHSTLSRSGEVNNAEKQWAEELEKHCRNLEGRLSKYEYVEPLRSRSCTHSQSSSKQQTLTFQNTMACLSGVTSTTANEDSNASINITVSNSDESSKSDKISFPTHDQESNSEAVGTTIPSSH